MLMISGAISSGFSPIPLDIAATNSAVPKTKAGSVQTAGATSSQTALFKQIQQSVLSALQSADNSGSTADPNQIVQQAIANVLRQNNPNTTAGSTSQTGDSNRAFFDTLNQYGIDPSQFRADYAAAVKDAQNGLNPLTAPIAPTSVGNLLDVSV
jgi:hypothetical protein